MNKCIALLLIGLLAVACGNGKTPAPEPEGGGDGPPPEVTVPTPLDKGTYELGCAMCIFEQEGASSCTSAVKVGDAVYLIVGEGVPDAHTSGLCSAFKQAEVAGRIEGGKVVAESIKVLE